MEVHWKELAQNDDEVLRGEMSLVGPRPNAPRVPRWLERAYKLSFRLAVRPGLTGLAQVLRTSDTDAFSMRPRRLALDLPFLSRPMYGLELARSSWRRPGGSLGFRPPFGLVHPVGRPCKLNEFVRPGDRWPTSVQSPRDPSKEPALRSLRVGKWVRMRNGVFMPAGRGIG